MFTAQELAELTREALSTTHPDDLAYLAVTGKIELPVRDALGALMTRKFPELTAAREFKRRDLAILRDGVPLAVIEGKLWISFEANVPSKLNNPNPKEGLLAAAMSDIEKMNDLHQTTGCERFTSTVLFGADIRQLETRHLPAIKFPHWHHRGLANNVGLEVAHSAGIDRYVEASAPMGSCAVARLFEGTAFGMPVLADVIICKVSD